MKRIKVRCNYNSFEDHRNYDIDYDYYCGLDLDNPKYKSKVILNNDHKIINDDHIEQLKVYNSEIIEFNNKRKKRFEQYKKDLIDYFNYYYEFKDLNKVKRLMDLITIDFTFNLCDITPFTRDDLIKIKDRFQIYRDLVM